MSKIDCLRLFLEKFGHRLTSQSHLRVLILSVLQNEKETLKSELSEAKAVSTIFDDSTRLGAREALTIIVRFVDSQWNVQQRLVRLQVLAKSLKAEELAQCLIQALAVECATQPGALLAEMKDGAYVNQAALLQARFFFPQLLDVTCFSHTIDNVGRHFEFRVLDTFAQYWVSLFSQCCCTPCVEGQDWYCYAVAVAAYPNVREVARRQAVGNLPVYNQLVAKAKAFINPGLQFFQRKFSQDCVIQYKRLASDLVESLNTAHSRGELSISQRRGVVTLIPKAESDTAAHKLAAHNLVKSVRIYVYYVTS